MGFSSDIVCQYIGKQGGFFASSGYLKMQHFEIVRGLRPLGHHQGSQCPGPDGGFFYPHLWHDKTQLKNFLGAARRAQKVFKLICDLKNLFRQFKKPPHFFQVSSVQNRCTPKSFTLLPEKF